MARGKRTRLPGVYLVSPGVYLVRVTTKDPATGKTRDRSRKVRARSAREAADKARDELAQEDDGADRPLTVEDIAERWLRHGAKRWTPSTHYKHSGIVRTSILPTFGAVEAASLTMAAIEAWHETLTVKPITANDYLTTLRLLLEYAVDRDLLGKNPAKRVAKLPVETQPKALPMDVVRALLAAVDPRWYPLILTLALTGMRRGEAFALLWRHIDLDAGWVRVERSVWTKLGVDHIGPPKGKRPRTIGLHPRLAAVLRDVRPADAHPDDLVFPGREYGFLRSNALDMPLVRAAKAIGLGRSASPHVLRHSLNNALRKTADGVVVRSLIGHTSEALTAHYSAVDLEEQLAALTRATAGWTEGATVH